MKSEFSVDNLRIDTLAFNKENNSFVIIEYKRDKNNSVIDQGVSYLNIMLSNKSDFILEYNETLGEGLKRDDVDWSQSQIIFISPYFNKVQKQATNFKDLPIELWEFKRFENDIFIINSIGKSYSAPKLTTTQTTKNDSTLSKIMKEVKVYTEEDLLANKSEEVTSLYESYKNAILNLATDIEIVPRKHWISFKKEKIIADIQILKNNLKLFINLKKGNLDDAKKLAEDVSYKGHMGNGDYQIKIDDTKNLEYIMSLVKQSL